MQLKISHVTEYAYAQPVRYALQRLRLTPQSSQLQTVHSWTTEVEGGAVEARYIDHFGNIVELVSASRDTEAIRVVATGLVETSDKTGVSGPHRAYMPLWLYQRESELTKPGKMIREMARGIGRGEPLEQLHGLMGALNKAMAYVPGATQTKTLAEDALANDMSPDDRYVHIAYGLDYKDAAPISGIRTGTGEEQLAVRITVEQ